MVMRRVPIVLLAVSILVACASGSSTRSTGSRNVITQEQIEALNVSTVYEVIQQLRPRFLQARGQHSIQAPTAGIPVVYIDGSRYGPLDVLHTLRAMDVGQIRFLSASDATTRYGTGHVGGVIEVTTRG